MNLREKLEYSNISEYRIGDTECENLVLKALKCGVETIVVGPSSLNIVTNMLKNEKNAPKVCVTVAYPSGAYWKDSKVQEMEGILELGYPIDGFYVVMQVGAYLSGRKDAIQQEMEAFITAANKIPVKLVTELGVLSQSQIEELCKMAIEAGISAIVTSTGFLPYDVTQADQTAYRQLVKAANGRIEIIANGDIKTKSEVEQLLKLGVDKICTTKAYEILNQ